MLAGSRLKQQRRQSSTKKICTENCTMHGRFGSPTDSCGDWATLATRSLRRGWSSDKSRADIPCRQMVPHTNNRVEPFMFDVFVPAFLCFQHLVCIRVLNLHVGRAIRGKRLRASFHTRNKNWQPRKP
eukprot:375332-Amphidinium_carterae.1